MAVLDYRDPGTGNWVVIPAVRGPVGLVGPPGPIGPVVISTVAGNTARAGSDGKVYIPAGGLDDATASSLYVNVVGDAMTGELLVPDQVAVGPVDVRTAVTKGYVDQVVTVSDVEPAGFPARDGLMWFMPGEAEVAAPPPPPPLPPVGVEVTEAGVITWTDQGGAATSFDVRWTDHSPVTDESTQVALGVLPGVQRYQWTVLLPGWRYCFGVKAVNSGVSSDYTEFDIEIPPLDG